MIEEYFARIRNFLNSLAIVQKFELETEARADYIGFIRGIVYFQDGTILHVREFVDVEFPHHKHQQQENNIVASDAPFLEEICQEIEQITKRKYRDSV